MRVRVVASFTCATEYGVGGIVPSVVGSMYMVAPVAIPGKRLLETAIDPFVS